MESEATNKSRVVMVESGECWDFYISQATTHPRPIAVHFTASWCLPSVAMNPVFEDLAAAHPYILFLTFDVDAVKEAAAKMEVKAMPTFVLMKDSAQVDKIVGANPEEIRKRLIVLFSPFLQILHSLCDLYAYLCVCACCCPLLLQVPVACKSD